MLALEIAAGVVAANLVLHVVAAVKTWIGHRLHAPAENAALRNQVAYMTAVVEDLSKALEKAGVKYSPPPVVRLDDKRKAPPKQDGDGDKGPYL